MKRLPHLRLRLPARGGPQLERISLGGAGARIKMIDEVLQRRGTILVRRQYLAPGETTPWHRDPFHRVAVVLSCDAIVIEYRDGSPSRHLAPAAGQVDWDEPTDRIHRAVNVGKVPYEEVTVFFLDQPNATPQPTAD